MWSILKSLFVKDNNSELVAQILAQVPNREDMLGMKAPIIPTPDGIRVDAAKILKYTDSDGYKKFAEESWARVIQGIDRILDPSTSTESLHFYRGEVNATLNLLRLSHVAKDAVKQFDQEHEASLQR